MRKAIAITMIALSLQLTMPAAYASDANPVRKFMRGVANFTLGWVEFFRQPILTNEAEGDLSAATWGVAKGVGFGLGRTLLGTYEMVAFLIPPYRTLAEPEFIFSDKE